MGDPFVPIDGVQSEHQQTAEPRSQQSVAASRSEPATPMSVASSSFNAAEAGGKANYETNYWAEAQLAVATSSDFQFPADYVLNTKDSTDVRKMKEARFRKQWEKAVEAAMEPVGDVWAWICPTCVASCGERLVGREVQVWWHDDERSYRGEVNAFDEASGSHRVLYEDDEWEFISLAIEPFVIYPAPQLAFLSAPTSSTGPAAKRQRTNGSVSGSTPLHSAPSSQESNQQQARSLLGLEPSSSTPVASAAVVSGSTSSMRVRRSLA